jgi:hypothetical protein
MRTRIAMTTLAVALGVAAAGFAAEPADGPEKPKADDSEHLQALIKVLEDTDNPSTAIAAYARAAAVDPKSVRLHRTYMRRMLRFGLPRIAYHPASALVTLSPENGTAWGVLSYMHGRKGELAKALAAGIRAAVLTENNESINHNTGQLLAWYENEIDRPKLSDGVRRTLDKHRQAFFEREDFAQAYRTMSKAYQERARLAKALDAKLDTAQERTEEVRRAALELDAELRGLNEEIEYRSEQIELLYRELHRSGTYAAQPVITGHGVEYIYVPRQTPAERAAIRERIHEHERVISALRRQRRQARRQGEGVLEELQRRQKALDRLRKQVKAALERVEQTFRWDPPAVDGVVTVERDHMPPPDTSLSLPEDPRRAAEQRLRLARLYLRNEMSEKAEGILVDLIDRYGRTEQAQEARKLLADLRGRR